MTEPSPRDIDVPHAEGPAITERDIIVRTGGLDEDELAAVVAVVRATIEEELAESDFGDRGPELATRRWRRAVDTGRGRGVGWGLDGRGADREWRA